MAKKLRRGALVLVAILVVGLAVRGAIELFFFSHLTANALMDRLNSRGIACREVRSGLSRPHDSFDWGQCEVGSSRVYVITYTNVFERDNGQGYTENIGGFSILEGPDWVISTPDDELAERIQAAVGGYLHR